MWFVLLVASGARADDELRVITGGSLPPFMYFDPSGARALMDDHVKMIRARSVAERGQTRRNGQLNAC